MSGNNYKGFTSTSKYLAMDIAPPMCNNRDPVMFQPQPTTMNNNTTVVLTQQPGPWKPPREWRSGLCGCFNNCSTCLLVLLFGPCFGANLARRHGECCCVGCMGVGIVALRTKTRTENNIVGSICSDMETVACCGPCALCQLSREMDAEGYPAGDCACC